MDVSFMQQSVGGSAMNFGGELPSFSLTKVSGFYFVFSICWLPFASLLLVSCCFPLGVLLSAAQYTMVQCGKSCYLHRRDAVTRIGGKQWTGGKHKIRNPNPAWKCKRVMHHKICPSQKFGSKTLLPKAACLDNQTFFANHFSWKHEISAHFHLISLSFSSEDQELFPPKKTRWLQGFLRSIPMLPQNTISSSFYQDKTFFTSVHISTHNITSYGRATSQFWVRLAVLMEEVQRHVPLGLVQRRAAKQMTCSEQDLPSKTQVRCWFEGSIKTSMVGSLTSHPVWTITSRPACSKHDGLLHLANLAWFPINSLCFHKMQFIRRTNSSIDSSIPSIAQSWPTRPTKPPSSWGCGFHRCGTTKISMFFLHIHMFHWTCVVTIRKFNHSNVRLGVYLSCWYILT